MSDRQLFHRLLWVMAGCSVIGGVIGWFSYDLDMEV